MAFTELSTAKSPIMGRPESLSRACIITEFGVADLYGMTLSQRAQALIAIAHPEEREFLLYQWRKTYCQ
jgi:acyl-CoA hydrolase